MLGTTTVNHLDIQGNLMYHNRMLTYQEISSTSPLYTQDSGNLSFALAIIILFLFVAFVGYMFNRMFKPKKW